MTLTLHLFHNSCEYSLLVMLIISYFFISSLNFWSGFLVSNSRGFRPLYNLSSLIRHQITRAIFHLMVFLSVLKMFYQYTWFFTKWYSIYFEISCSNWLKTPRKNFPCISFLSHPKYGSNKSASWYRKSSLELFSM